MQGVAGALSQLLDVEVSVLGQLPHRFRLVRQERGFRAQQPLIPGEATLVVAHRNTREEVNRHALNLTREEGSLSAASCIQRLPGLLEQHCRPVDEDRFLARISHRPGEMRPRLQDRGLPGRALP